MSEAFASFAVNFIRREFDRNDQNEDLAYFELLSEDELPRRMRRLFSKRKRWARDDYVKFCEQLDEVEDRWG
jgi:hypothetical protein